MIPFNVDAGGDVAAVVTFAESPEFTQNLKAQGIDVDNVGVETTAPPPIQPTQPIQPPRPATISLPSLPPPQRAPEQQQVADYDSRASTWKLVNVFMMTACTVITCFANI